MWKEKEKARPGWRFIERYKDPYTGKLKRVSVYFETDRKKDEKAAAEVLAEKIRAKTQPAPSVESGMTFGQLVDEYLAWQKETNKKQSYINALGHFNTLKRVIGEDVLVSRIDMALLDRNLWRIDIVKKGAKPETKKPEAGKCEKTTYNGRVKRLKAIFRWAYKKDIIDTPRLADRLEYVKDDGKQKGQRFLEKREYVKLIQSMTVDRWRYLSRLLLLTGCRVGEAIALRVDDIDIEKETLSIFRTWSMNIRGLSTVKTESSRREIPVQDELRGLIGEIMRFRAEDIRANKYAPSRLLIPGPRGGFCEYEAYEKYLRETSERVLGRRITSHMWRHTHVSILASQGVDLMTIMRRVGHGNSKITREIYLHVTEEQKQKDAAAVRDLRFE